MAAKKLRTPKVLRHRLEVRVNSDLLSRLERIQLVEGHSGMGDTLRALLDEGVRLKPWFEERMRQVEINFAHQVRCSIESNEVMVEAYNSLTASVNKLLEEAGVEGEEDTVLEDENGTTYRAATGEVVERDVWNKKSGTAHP